MKKMGRVAASVTLLFFLGILLEPLRWLDAAIQPCPASCHCTLKILNCSRTTNSHVLNHVPVPEPFAHPYVFVMLDFTGNTISSINKHVWWAYPWTEYLILKNNHLSRLDNTSLDGLLPLTHLDVSYNQIRIIDKNAFEPAPLLQSINLSGNHILQITQGAFQAWHGMQFLYKLILSHNPLRKIEDSHFYTLPSLKFLDLGSTKIAIDILENLLKISFKLKTLILPRKISCCLCQNQDTFETSNTIKLDCPKECVSNAFDYEKEELWGTMEDEVKKVLKTRKLNATNILNIVPEKPEQHNVTLSLMVTHGRTHLGIHFHQHVPDNLQSVNGFIPDEYVDVKWSDKKELEKLYKLTNLLQVALKAKLAENERESHGLEIQKELPVEIPDYGSIILSNKSHRKKLKNHLKRVKRDHWLGKNPREKELFYRLFRKCLEFANATRKLAGEQGKLVLYTMAERWEKLAKELKFQKSVSFNRLLLAALHSLQNHSISNLPTKLPPFTDSVVVEDGAEDSETSNEDLPDTTLSHETHWEHHEQTISALPLLHLLRNINNWLQDELYEVELNTLLASVFPRESEILFRKLFYCLIHLVNVNCREPTIQMACAELISRMDLTKNFSVKSSQETPVLLNSYFRPTENVNDMIMANSRKMEKPSDEEKLTQYDRAPGNTSAREVATVPSWISWSKTKSLFLDSTFNTALPIAWQEIPQFEYYKKLLLGISVAVLIMVIIAMIILIMYLRNRRRETKGTSKKVSLGEEEGGEENLSYYDRI